MDNIEQKFFDAFKPKYIYQYRVYMEHNNGQVIKYYWDKELLMNVFSDKTYKKREHIKKLKVCEVIKHNPPITPAIVLGLMKIIQSNFPKNAILEIRAGLDFTTQVLNSCILLQPEIQDQVKDLFNGK